MAMSSTTPSIDARIFEFLLNPENAQFTVRSLRDQYMVRIPANVTGHSGDRDRFAHGLHAGESFVR